ncbi:DM13 domain-containing protein [Coleofasciculus sp. H7-2]|uniref:DM13 domain-containing protein n=1 Tax=Coleofasciculus sp. H7-2 TaxID=3351545 RepID=UPI00366DA168
MKLNHLAILGMTFLVTSVATGLTEIPLFKAVSPTFTSNGIAVAQTRPTTRSGTFVAAEQPTSGTARIVTENGQRYLEFNAAFKTSEQGPDLHVILDTSEKPPQTYQNQNRFINLGKLQKVSGAQRYPIPAAINLANFKSVVIWCRMANATFGYASLGGASNASTR